MKIIQILVAYAYGDAIGNEVTAIDEAFGKMGYKTYVYAQYVDGRQKRANVKKIKNKEDFQKFESDDLIIYHLSTGTEFNTWVKAVKGKLIVRYHNITPADFFTRYDQETAKRCAQGREEIPYLADRADYCIADSEYNKQELVEAGYKCDIEVVPILMSFDDYAKGYDKDTYNTIKDGKVNILFTGRVAPNKKHEDLIRTFYNYKKYYNKNSRLILLGNNAACESYYYSLRRYMEKLGLTDEDVVFTGHIPFKAVLSYFRAADVLLCMSEHEGFCVPLVEAMYFGIPIVARNTTAIPDTLGDSGVIINEKNYLLTAGVIDYIMTHEDYKREIIAKEKERLQHFDNKKVLLQMTNSIIKNK